MELNQGKLSNYNGQSKDPKKLNEHLVALDRDLQNLWRIVQFISPMVGSAKAVLNSNANIGFSYIPLIDQMPTGTPTNYTGHTAMVFCNSNSSLYIFNSSNNNWKVEVLT